jgi:rhodanese-related sulfurtransferase
MYLLNGMREQANSVHFKHNNMNITLKYITIITAFFAVISCSGIYEDGSEMASEIKSQVKSIDLDSLNKMLLSGENLLIIDIRNSSDFYTESMPGSVFISRGMLEFKISNEEFWAEQYMYPPEKNSKIIIISKNGDLGIISILSLMKLGYTNVFNLEEGYNAFTLKQIKN